MPDTDDTWDDEEDAEQVRAMSRQPRAPVEARMATDRNVAWYAADLAAIGVGQEDELCHQCLGLDSRRLALAKGLQSDGLVIVEDSADGPMVTRTHQGTMMLKRAGRRALAAKESAQ